MYKNTLSMYLIDCFGTKRKHHIQLDNQKNQALAVKILNSKKERTDNYLETD